jgi:hypothetical protein
MSVKAALGAAEIASADDRTELQAELEKGADLILFNREVGYGFEPSTGVDLIRELKPKYPTTRMMLVSNFPEAQAAAVAAGAVPGFGKRELGTPKVKKLLQDGVTVSA